jgi:ribonuclease PH
MSRHDGRLPHQLRPVRIIPAISPYAEGSARIEVGNTHVHCTASVETGIPSWLRGQGRGWVTAEYALLPRSTLTRTRRERTGPGGRTQEIQRLIGRSLRAAIDLEQLGEQMITVDCDVLQADGGTRTAAITGGYVALALAISRLLREGLLETNPLRHAVAAVSVGMLGDNILLDLDYEEDSRADVDCNIVQTAQGGLVEVQSTAEGTPARREQIHALIDLACQGIGELFALQHMALDNV